VEYYNFTGSLNATPGTYNNLLLNNTDGGGYNMTMAANLTVTGDLTLRNTAGSGTLSLTIGNSATPRTLTAGNITTGTRTRLQTGTLRCHPQRNSQRQPHQQRLHKSDQPAQPLQGLSNGAAELIFGEPATISSTATERNLNSTGLSSTRAPGKLPYSMPIPETWSCGTAPTLAEQTKLFP
jgi:hypothetical protein